MKLRNILITVAAMGMMYASADRVGVVGYSAGDYTDMNTFPHKAAGQNVAWTAGDNFTAVWTDGGATWGFSGGAATELANMKWSNGTYGLSVGLDMPAGGDTTFDLGFGMNFMGWDVGVGYGTADGAPMTLNARGNCGFWVFDTATFAYSGDDNFTTIDMKLYSVSDWGAATGYFAMGYMTTDNAYMYNDGAEVPTNTWVEGPGGITTSFSVESTLTDWCDLRIGYNKLFNMGAADGEASSSDSYVAGLGFNYGSVALDMTISSGTLDSMVSNPLNYMYGRNNELASTWTLSYTW
jgi:hypothetical protein